MIYKPHGANQIPLKARPFARSRHDVDDEMVGLSLIVVCRSNNGPRFPSRKSIGIAGPAAAQVYRGASIGAGGMPHRRIQRSKLCSASCGMYAAS